MPHPTVSEQTTEQLGETLATEGGTPLTDRFDILREVGRGGMGVVYQARHKQLGMTVALKVMKCGAPSDRFLREARLLAQIRSPHVVPVHDFEILRDGSPMLVMDWVEGSDLDRVRRDRPRPLDEGQVLEWMEQVALGMQAVAEQGIIHRDLKPSNILIDSAGKAWVADFGLARGGLERMELSMTGAVMGTPHYMAPEQAETPRSVDSRADVYSFGATFYHLLTGHLPFDGETFFNILYKHKTETLVAPRARNPQLSEKTAALLEKCLAKSPTERFAGFDEILKTLRPGTKACTSFDADDDPALQKYLQLYLSRLPEVANKRRGSEPDVYEFHDGGKLSILVGNLAEQRVEALVSSDDEFLTMSGGVSMAIGNAAGREAIQAEMQKYVPVRRGRAVVTSAGALPARFVFHGVTLAFGEGSLLWPSRDLIVEILQSCVYHAETLNVKSLALPLLGTGTGRLSAEVCLETTFHFLARTLLRGLTPLRDVRIVLFR